MVVPPDEEGSSSSSDQNESAAATVSQENSQDSFQETAGTLESLSSAEQDALAQRVMRRQGALSLQVATLFVLLLFVLPLFNLYQPTLAAYNIMGFPATWLFLGVLFYPITVLLSIYFVRRSDQIEAETAQAWRAETSGATDQTAIADRIKGEHHG